MIHDYMEAYFHKNQLTKPNSTFRQPPHSVQPAFPPISPLLAGPVNPKAKMGRPRSGQSLPGTPLLPSLRYWHSASWVSWETVCLNWWQTSHATLEHIACQDKFYMHVLQNSQWTLKLKIYTYFYVQWYLFCKWYCHFEC